jgi:hypothetical protein
MKYTLSIFLPLLYSITFAQSVQNVRVSQTNEDVFVTYDLVDTKPSYISLYFSKDGGTTFSQELRQVGGDIKTGVKPGTNKKINWNAGKELGVFDGEMIFKVEASSKKIGFPKPVSDEFFSVEVTNAFFEGSDLKVEFKVTNISDKPVIYATLSQSGTMMLDDQGNTFESPDIRIVNKKYHQQIEFSKDTAYKGFSLVKNANPELSIISLLKINLEFSNWSYSYSIRNIPINQ